MSEKASDYQFEEITFLSDRMSTEVDLISSTSDLEIFEHIEKPYLTGMLVITDAERFYEKADILGGERIRVTIKSTRDQTTSFTKLFYIDRVISTQKSTERDTTIVFHLVEDVKFLSNLQTLSKSYRGTPEEIIEKIGKYINKEINVVGQTSQQFKVIIPNLTPLEAMSWIKNRAATNEGYPFYLYSTLVGDKLNLIDLGSMISQDALTRNYPFKYYQSAMADFDILNKRRTIQYYKHNDVEDLYTMIAKGLIGSKYQYINTIDENTYEFNFDIVKDLLKPITNKLLTGPQKNALYSPDFGFHEQQSRYISQFAGSHVFDTADRILSYNENIDVANYKQMIISRAMETILKKAPLEIGVKGIEFIDGEVNTTIGNNIGVEFINSNPHNPQEELLRDSKLSSNYMIYATRHMFKREKYDLSLSCVKLANYVRA